MAATLLFTLFIQSNLILVIEEKKRARDMKRSKYLLLNRKENYSMNSTFKLSMEINLQKIFLQSHIFSKLLQTFDSFILFLESCFKSVYRAHGFKRSLMSCFVRNCKILTFIRL